MGQIIDIRSRKQVELQPKGKAKDKQVKTYVFDTSALLDLPDTLENIQSGNIVIPTVVIGELDYKKTDSRLHIARAARGIANLLNFWSSKGSSSKGIALGDKVKFYIYDYYDVDFHLKSKADSLIIGTAMKFRDDFKIKGKDIAVISTDTNLRTIAEREGFKSDIAPDDYDILPTTVLLSNGYDINDKIPIEPLRYDHSANWGFPRISRDLKIIITGVLLAAGSVAGIVLTYPATVMDALKDIKGYAKYTVPVVLGAGFISGLSLIIGKVVGFLKLRKLRKEYPGIREDETIDDWMFRKMPEAVFDEHIRRKEEEKKIKAKG